MFFFRVLVGLFFIVCAEGSSVSLEKIEIYSEDKEALIAEILAIQKSLLISIEAQADAGVC